MNTIEISADLMLIQCRIEDASALFHLTDRNREFLKEFLPWLDTVRGVEDSRQFIRFGMEQAKNKQGFHYGIWYQGNLAGTIAVHGIKWAHCKTTIGYWLGSEYQGKGIMTKAIEAYLDRVIFGEWNLHRVEIAAATINLKSRAIPERLGFQLEGIIRENEWLYDHYVDHAVYGMLQHEWKRVKQSRLI
ncbi:GNAT family N-acetyltransferase [Brevibacillus daliensis]|uniref:GNAT family N-acetyltransferase n=1 Tax=Brevibacillus daliensis TaxID=2892995 RepID=UPI001E5D1DBB|nr:GNAT family protein [Brevibacillus daliensis]